jgi:hypothetical protein
VSRFESIIRRRSRCIATIAPLQRIFGIISLIFWAAAIIVVLFATQCLGTAAEAVCSAP